MNQELLERPSVKSVDQSRPLNAVSVRNQASPRRIYFLNYRQSFVGFLLFTIAIALFTVANVMDYFHIWHHSQALSNFMLGFAILIQITTCARVTSEEDDSTLL